MTATQRDRYLEVRRRSERFCDPLAVEDYGLQAMASTSPAKWHLAHTAWFFETFLLKPFAAGYQSPQPQFEQLFNSYYNGIGQPFARHRRGLLSRPTVAEVYQYRAAVDDAMQALISAPPAQHAETIANRVELGLHHEQQHQELFFTDLKYCFAQNPLYPRYHSTTPAAAAAVTPLSWWQHPGGQVQIGNHGQGFAFDNEMPAHPVLLQPFALANRLVSNAEFLQFIADGGYRRPELWLADGWQVVQDQGWQHPLYWQREAGDAMNSRNPENHWQEYRLAGLQPLEPAAPVCHLSAYEADAYA
ncbi:MAG TPA: ergothioneine biosynthesis protein EgtB, partial [Spongiibacteraceae bacterium]|nr:ergothioneine biosynthesis protein EgtB [Spongiibacteraceae bacterium]